MTAPTTYIANVSSERIAELLQKLLFVLRDSSEPMQPCEAVNIVRSQVTLTPFEQSRSSSGVDRFYNIFSFASIPLKKIDWLASINYRWLLTETGRHALEKYPDAMQFRNAANKQYRAWINTSKQLYEKTIQESVDAADGTPDSPESVNMISSEAIDEQEDDKLTFLQETQYKADQFISEYLKTLKGSEFEQLVAALLAAMGYYIQWIATGGGDGGIDILASNDPLGVQPPHIKVQAKNWATKASAPNIREFSGSISDRDSGIFVCAGGFTSEALKESRQKGITTMDRYDLVRLWAQYSEKMNAQAQNLLPLVPVYLLRPSE